MRHVALQFEHYFEKHGFSDIFSKFVRACLCCILFSHGKNRNVQFKNKYIYAYLFNFCICNCSHDHKHHYEST
jgi:hypothetical protein